MNLYISILVFCTHAYRNKENSFFIDTIFQVVYLLKLFKFEIEGEP